MNDVESFMMDFISTGDQEIDEHYYAVEKKFEEKFGYMPPTAMLPDSITDEQIVVAMNECINQGKDVFFSVLKIKLDEDVLY